MFMNRSVNYFAKTINLKKLIFWMYWIIRTWFLNLKITK
jgi:hypothetical protein